MCTYAAVGTQTRSQMAKRVEIPRNEEGMQNATNNNQQEGRMENQQDKDGLKMEEKNDSVGKNNTRKLITPMESGSNNIKLRQRLPRRAKTQRTISPTTNHNLQKSITEHLSSLSSVGTTSTATTATLSIETSTTTPKQTNSLGNKSLKTKKSQSLHQTTTDFFTKKAKIEKMNTSAKLVKSSKRRKGAKMVTQTPKSIIQNLGDALFLRNSNKLVDIYKHLSKFMTNKRTFPSSDEEEDPVINNNMDEEVEMEMEMNLNQNNNKSNSNQTNVIHQQEVIVIEDEGDKEERNNNTITIEEEDVIMDSNTNNNEIKMEKIKTKQSNNEDKKNT